MLGYPKVYGEEKDGISQDLVLWNLGRNVIKCVTGGGRKRPRSAFRKTCLPLKGLSLIMII